MPSASSMAKREQQSSLVPRGCRLPLLFTCLLFLYMVVLYSFGLHKLGGDSDDPPPSEPAHPPPKSSSETSARRGSLRATTDTDASAQSSKLAKKLEWRKYRGRSCQNYAGGDSTDRSFEESKVACASNDECVAIECPHGTTDQGCSIRSLTNLVKYSFTDCWIQQAPDEGSLVEERGAIELHPEYETLIQEYPFQPVMTHTGQKVNIILVRSPFRGIHHKEMYNRLKDDILFMGISSFEDYPLNSGNPFSGHLDEQYYLNLFPGFLHMMHEPNKYFPPHVKTILMSQSDFSLPIVPPRDYSIPRKYDFTLSGSDQDVYNDCVGWSSYAKNWTFVKEALVVMCGEYNLKGVLVATVSKNGKKACTIPDSCKGKIIQTKYLDQQAYFNYLKQSRFAFLPQIHDASPRVSTQALAHDVPVLMNAYISGGWKYVNNKTGEFFHDMSDLRQSLDKILKNADIPYRYEPRKWLHENYGSKHAGPRLLDL